VGHCLVGSVAFSDSGTNFNLGLTCLFSQEKIKEMECELLVSNFRNPETIALVKENIGQSSDGSSSHRASMLKLGLRKASELKKQKRQLPGVLLRCSDPRCAWRDNPVPSSTAGYCPNCGYRHWMMCVGCDTMRTSNYTSCQGCVERISYRWVYLVGLPICVYSRHNVVALYQSDIGVQ